MGFSGPVIAKLEHASQLQDDPDIFIPELSNLQTKMEFALQEAYPSAMHIRIGSDVHTIHGQLTSIRFRSHIKMRGADVVRAVGSASHTLSCIHPLRVTIHSAAVQ